MSALVLALVLSQYTPQEAQSVFVEGTGYLGWGRGSVLPALSASPNRA